jgi:hypothetical protein
MFFTAADIPANDLGRAWAFGETPIPRADQSIDITYGSFVRKSAGISLKAPGPCKGYDVNVDRYY